MLVESHMYIKRMIEREMLEASKEFTCLTIYGARQVGKSTAVSHLFENFKSITLDDLSMREYAINDPKGFLDFYGCPLIIDEIQRAPALLNYIKIKIDEYKLERLKIDKKPQLIYVLTGSNQFELQEAISESLAGRTAVLNMCSLSFGEIYGYEYDGPFNPDLEVLSKKEKEKHVYRSRKEIFDDIFRGGMPELVALKPDRDRYFGSYVSAYIERDVKKVINSSKETAFLSFMQCIALRTANQIDYTDISRSLGIDVRTVKSWLSILETSGIVKMLYPYMAHVSTNVIKSPKLYFLDTGLCAYLARIPSAEILEKSAFAGPFYETYVVSEIMKTYLASSNDYKKDLYYYRDKEQKEIDLIIDSFAGLYPIEIKKGINPVSRKKNFDILKKYNRPIMKGLVIDSCEKLAPINDDVFYCPISLIGL